jgi:DNA-binding transcriptional regulator/RsmH inhibitor MraZ
MFFGTFYGQIDKQKRICIPSEFRKILLDGRISEADIVYLKAYEGGIEIYPPWEMKAIYEEFKNKSILEAQNRDEMANIAREFYKLKFGSINGRFIVPEELLKGFPIGAGIVFEGGGRFIRVRPS